MNVNLKRKRPRSEAETHSHMFTLTRPASSPAHRGLALAGNPDGHGSERACDQPQGPAGGGSSVCGAPAKDGGVLRAIPSRGVCSRARLAVWDLCGYHLQPEVLLPCHMSAVRSPRKCLASFYISIFLLMPSNILDLQDEKNKISQ